jgi:energy-coupling factor transporter ATP-binding protein EcfA2
MTGTSSGRPLLVEIIGPAGAGKTTLLRTLCSADSGIRAGLDIGRLRFLTALVGKVGPLVPIWVRDHRHDRWFNRRELRSIAFVEAWYRAMEEEGSADLSARVFDHGPLYRLSRLKAFGPDITRSEPFQRWWRVSRERWMGALDLIVWLDAPDDVLLQRVEERGHQYLDATPSGEGKKEFLARYRGVFAEILEHGAAKGPRTLRLRSDERSVEEIADEVLDALASTSARAVPSGGSVG